MANQPELKPVEVEEPDIEPQPDETQADSDDPAIEPATQPAAPPQEPPPSPPVAAASPAPAPVPPPVVMSDEECNALLARHGWDAEAVRNQLITGQLIVRAKGKQFATFDASYQDAFDARVHFGADPNSQAAASLWADHVNIRVDRFYLGWKELRATSGQRETVRLAKMFEQQLIAWAALPVAQKISPEQQAAAQARVVADHAAMARTAAVQYPEMMPSGRLAAYRRTIPDLGANADFTKLTYRTEIQPQTEEGLRREKPALLEALRAEKLKEI